MTDTSVNNNILHELCSGQLLAVLATDAGDGPYASLVAVAMGDYRGQPLTRDNLLSNRLTSFRNIASVPISATSR